MRNAFIQALVERARSEKFLFLTGDVGFNLLEPLRDALGPRFLNCGIAEQNMISVAAGLSKTGWEVWAYTIAPFCYARAYEQIRVDLAFHRLPVKLLGSGGGYAYGPMGPSHHALEDYGVLTTLEDFPVFVPSFRSDLPRVLQRMIGHPGPSYVRLEHAPGRLPDPVAVGGSWRRLLEGDGPVLISCGTLAAELRAALEEAGWSGGTEMWSVSELPVRAVDIPAELWRALEGRPVLIAEEHVRQGGLASQLSLALLEAGVRPLSFGGLWADGYPGALYGSQVYHRAQVGLDPRAILARLAELGRRES